MELFPLISKAWLQFGVGYQTGMVFSLSEEIKLCYWKDSMSDGFHVTKQQLMSSVLVDPETHIQENNHCKAGSQLEVQLLQTQVFSSGQYQMLQSPGQSQQHYSATIQRDFFLTFPVSPQPEIGLNKLNIWPNSI